VNPGEQRSIRALIVDDEPLARSNVAVLLRRDPQVEIVEECGSGKEALAAIRELKPGLLFLDVQMPEFDGFDVLEALGQNMPPAVIFVTAYDEHAIRAFESGALDYLLKPFDNARFERSLNRAKERLALDRSAANHLDRIVVKSAGQIVFLNVGDIDWIGAADYYASLHVGAKTYLLRRSMGDLEKELDPRAFCRTHRSAIVSLSRVERIAISENGENEIALKNGARLPLSRRYKKQLQSRLGVCSSELFST
jgi:two-component system LytT family response regulator